MSETKPIQAMSDRPLFTRSLGVLTRYVVKFVVMPLVPILQ
jgi:hypothetical protein